MSESLRYCYYVLSVVNQCRSNSMAECMGIDVRQLLVLFGELVAPCGNRIRNNRSAVFLRKAIVCFSLPSVANLQSVFAIPCSVFLQQCHRLRREFQESCIRGLRSVFVNAFVRRIKQSGINAICKYFLSGEITELQGNAAYVFELQKDSIERGREGYLKKVEGGKYGANVRYGKTDL